MSDNESETDEGVLEERRLMRDFVSQNFYIDYATLSSELENNKDYFVYAAEYGEYQHELMETIFNNITDTRIIKKCGRKINKLGGFTAMQGCFYCFCYALRLIGQRENINEETGIHTLRCIRTHLEIEWHEIGEWRRQ